MKKSLLCLLALLCSFNLFVSCSDDDDNNAGLNGTYSGDNLTLRVSGVTVTGKSVAINSTSAEAGVLTLNGIVAGEPESRVDVKISATTKAEEGYSIQGENKTDARTVTVKGEITGKKLDLDVNLKLTNELVGTWALPQTGGCFFVNLDNASGNVTFMGQTIPNANFVAAMDQMAEPFLYANLRDVTFKDNGYIVASFSREGNGQNFETSPEGVVSYYVKDGAVVIVPDFATLIRNLGPSQKSTGGDYNPFAVLSNLPIKYKLDGTSAEFYVDKAMMAPMLTPVGTLLGFILTSNKDKYLSMFGEISKIINDSKSMQLGLNLDKK